MLDSFVDSFQKSETYLEGPPAGPIVEFRHAVQGYVIVDGPVPRDGLSHLDMMRGSSPRLAEAVRSALAAGCRFPDPDAQSRARSDGERPVSASPRGRRFFEEPIAVPAGWSDSSCGYIKLSAAFDQPYQKAVMRGWPTRSLDGDHFSQSKFSVAEELCAEDFVEHQHGIEPPNREGLEGAMAFLHRLSADQRTNNPLPRRSTRCVIRPSRRSGPSSR